MDNILYFKGDTVTSNFRSNSNINLSVDDGFVKITPSTSNQWQQFSVGGQNTGWLDPTKDYHVEFDFICPSTNYNTFNLCGANIRFNYGTANTEHSAKIELVNGVVKVYIDGITTASATANVGTGTDCSFGLYSVEYLKIKNFKLYPI